LAGAICGRKAAENSERRDTAPHGPLIPEHAIARSGESMIAIGIVLLIIGFLTGIAILWTIGIIVLVIGLIAMLLGMTGHAVGGRRHYW
jgi:1,4-dihydroxy-2-naphthoate octaprenyltransferase